MNMFSVLCKFFCKINFWIKLQLPVCLMDFSFTFMYLDNEGLSHSSLQNRPSIR